MNLELVELAKQCLGTPFKHQGRVNGVALDCAGVLAYCLDKMGLPYNDLDGYARTPFDGQLEKSLDGQPSMRKINICDAEAGDVLLMRMKTAPQHIAIHAGTESGHIYIIHGSEPHGKVVHHRLDDLWRAKVVSAYRVEANQ